MQSIATEKIGECWLKSIQCVLNNGTDHYDEDVSMKELRGLCLKIENPSPHDSIINSAGDRRVIDNMQRKFSKGVTMPDRPFTYGQLIYDNDGVDQFEWLVRRLRQKSETKSATISLLTAGSESANLPCLNVLDAKLRSGALELHFFFRSLNVFGRQYANLIALAEFQRKLIARLGCRRGPMKGYIASAHIYEYDFSAALDLVNGKTHQIVDQYYKSGPASIRSESQ